MGAAYIHARSPGDSSIAFYGPPTTDAIASSLPVELQAHLSSVEVQILLPTEESPLRPWTATVASATASTPEIAPGLWRIPALALPLRHAVPWLGRQEPDDDRPELRFLIHASRLVESILDRGDFVRAEGGALNHLPQWSPALVRCLAVLAELVPGNLLTARLATADDPVYAVTPRNLLVSLVTQAVDELVGDRQPRPHHPHRLPREFWRAVPQPVLEIQTPDVELEDGVPWSVQLFLRPVEGVELLETLESLKERQSRSLFPDTLLAESLAEAEEHLEELAARLPALRRAMNMADGRASLNRQELDQVLDHLPLLESAGFEVRLPALGQVEHVSARVTLAEEKSDTAAMRPWFEFTWTLALGDKELSQKDFEELVSSRSALVHLQRGPVLLSPRDRHALAVFKKHRGEKTRLGLFEALRLKLGGASHVHGLAAEELVASPKLEEIAATLDRARTVVPRPRPPGFCGELRPYQERGHAWMYFLMDQGFGACLADDMGLGKTVQAISILLDWRQDPARRLPTLIVCPVSVLGNWRREIHRFAPELRVELHHGKSRARSEEALNDILDEVDVLLTSYSLLQRDEELLGTRQFEGVILDEAQNIKNPNTRQSRAARNLRGKFRLVLTGTPLENRPLDLWSIMDFLNQGLLGSKTSFTRTLEHPIVKQRSQGSMSTLGRLVHPFVLRRLKTDPEIISDLPEKTEQVVMSRLTREQVVLYEAIVRKGMGEVEQAAEGIQRRGIILTTLLRLKQICNHPTHFLMDGSSLPGRSGKMDLLTEMVEEALDEGDRCLIFTQFKEMGSLIKTHLENTLKQNVLFLHGSVPQKGREEMVLWFQSGAEDSPKIFVLSLKAGGTGLNLTMANRVFHFDRWWNPAGEDQATDRAFRIGQRRDVFVHKFVGTGTLEERIQEMLERKRAVARSLLGGGENWITELSNKDLRRLLILDRKEALS